MRVAFYSRERWKMEPQEALARTCYDMIVIYSEDKTGLCSEMIRQIKRNDRNSVITMEDNSADRQNGTKYTAFFNGQPCILDTGDIFFLESYHRKTSVVVEKERIRIRARLDEEEERLPEDSFVRINRHNIINMQYIRNVKGGLVEMQNGEVLYVNDGRKKMFEDKYQEFLRKNCLML